MLFQADQRQTVARKYKDNRRVELILDIAFPNAKRRRKRNKWNETRRTVFFLLNL